MTYASRLRASHELKNWPGAPKIDPDVIDRMIEKENIRIMKRRVLCKSCMTYKSVSGSCFC